MATQLHPPSRTFVSPRPVLRPELPPVPLPRQARVAVRGLLSRDGGRPFLLYGQGQAGSSLLGHLLAGHPELEFGDEVLRSPVKAPAAYLNGLRARTSAGHFGCHVKPYHLTDFQRVDDPGRWLRRRQHEGWLVLHVTRRNTLLQVLATMARDRGADGSPFVVDKDELLNAMRWRAQCFDDELRQLSGMPVVEISYEDDLLPGPDAWARTTRRVFAELGVEPRAVSTTLATVVPSRLEDVVDNADAVRRAVAPTRWSDCLDGLG